LYTTKQLRPNDMGTLTLGETGFTILNGSSTFTVGPNICAAGCTSQNSGPMNIVSTILHMHRLGKSMMTQHFRGGQELRPLAQRDYFDYNWQVRIHPSFTLASP
jgi:Copper type II ascorbate-dependent monooxygenase, C-terminal domain